MQVNHKITFNRLRHVSGRIYQILDTQLVIDGTPIVSDIEKLYTTYYNIRDIPNTSKIIRRDEIIVLGRGWTIRFKYINPYSFKYIIEDRLIDGIGRYITHRSEEYTIEPQQIRSLILQKVGL